MADLVKKLNKAGVGLHPGEQFEAAMVLHPSGMARKASMGGVLGRAMEKRARKEDPELASDVGIAARMPEGPAILGLTPTRIVVYEVSGMSGKPKEIALSLARDDISSIELGKDKIGPSAMIGFSDGSGKMYETPMRNKQVEAFIGQVAG